MYETLASFPSCNLQSLELYYRVQLCNLRVVSHDTLSGSLAWFTALQQPIKLRPYRDCDLN